MFVLAATKLEDRIIINQVKRVSDHEFAVEKHGSVFKSNLNFSFQIWCEVNVEVEQ